MPTALEQKMLRNIKLYGPYKVFTKRVFLPLTTIYASQAASLSVAEIGTTTAVAAGVSIVLETTTGFWADKYGRGLSARIGALLAVLATTCYVLFPNFWGIMAGSVLLSMGYSFLSGSVDALMHDSLIVLKRTADYAKIASRAQSLSLIVNAFFVALVPLLYPVDKRLPFVAGIGAYAVLFLLANLFTEPPIAHKPLLNQQKFRHAIRSVISRGNAFFFIMAGLAFACSIALVDLYSLGYIEIGLLPQYLGLLFATASITGAILGYYIHRLKSLSFRQYASFDLLTNLAFVISLGIFKSVPLVIAMFIINMSFYRYQGIMYQHYILQAMPHAPYKATLLSIISNVRLIHEVWIIILFSGIANDIGVLPSISYSALFMLATLPLLLIGIGQFERNSRASSTLVTQ